MPRPHIDAKIPSPGLRMTALEEGLETVELRLTAPLECGRHPGKIRRIDEVAQEEVQTDG